MEKKAEVSNDVYVLGLILYELCSGMHPAAGPLMTPIETVRNQLLVEPPQLASLSTPERVLPGDLSELCARALAKRPALRCSMRELADGLAIVLSRLRAPRRAAARNQAASERSAALAKTEAMAASGPGGTIVMPARMATPPPAPSAPPPEQSRPREPLLVPIPVPTREVTAPDDRRSSGTPVERPAPRLHLRARPALAMVAAVLALGLAGTAWRLVGARGAVAARAPPAPDPAPVTASATSPPRAPPPGGSAPPAEASAPRRRARPPPARTGTPPYSPMPPFP